GSAFVLHPLENPGAEIVIHDRARPLGRRRDLQREVYGPGIVANRLSGILRVRDLLPAGPPVARVTSLNHEFRRVTLERVHERARGGAEGWESPPRASLRRGFARAVGAPTASTRETVISTAITGIGGQANLANPVVPPPARLRITPGPRRTPSCATIHDTRP